MTVDANAGLVRRYYEAMWNQWNYGLVDEILAETIVFRGSSGDEVRGRDAFREYMRKISRAFPDFHNRIAEMVAEGDRVATRLAYTGTHRGELFGLAPTGRRIEYAGTGFYRIRGGEIVEGWVLGDVVALLRQLGSHSVPE